MEEIRLSQINDANLTDEQIDNIVYSDTEDDGLFSEYAFVFVNSILINERVNTSVDADIKYYMVDKFLSSINSVA